MTHGSARRPGMTSLVMITLSMAASVGISLAMDATLVLLAPDAPGEILVAAILFNGTCILQSAVGGLIEWRRPGHTIGRLLMLGGPLYAYLAAGWQTAELIEPIVDPQLYLVVNWASLLLSWPGVALIAGWIPLLFPTGSLPGPRWRGPVGALVVMSGIGLAALAVRPGPMVDTIDAVNPMGIEGWPPVLQPFIDAIPIELVALIALAAAGLSVRYRRGDRVERLQIRWFIAAVTVAAAGFAGVIIEQGLRTDDGPLVSALVAYAGILAMPVAIGVAVTRHRLYEIDRIISRTIGWAIVTACVVAIYLGGVLVLQGALGGVTQGDTLAVAASTLVAAAAVQPLRRRIQRLVDRRFHRARYDAERTAAGFVERLRDEVELDAVTGHLGATTREAVAPRTMTLWLRSRNDFRTREA